MSPQRSLANKDKILAKIIKGTKLSPLKLERNYFRSLVLAVISQQLSGKAADTIAGRFVELFGNGIFPSPEEVLKINAPRLRKAGLSKSKANYIKNLARHFVEGKIETKKINKWEDVEVITHLTAIKGIGRWTAEMFLIFSLGRPDVFSTGDLGLRNAVVKIYRLRKPPSAKKLERISNNWRPHRSLACRYLWASLK